MSGVNAKEPKGVRLDHISKIYKNPKTGKDFYALRTSRGAFFVRSYWKNGTVSVIIG